jgi:hypothetical protein
VGAAEKEGGEGGEGVEWGGVMVGHLGGVSGNTYGVLWAFMRYGDGAS